MSVDSGSSRGRFDVAMYILAVIAILCGVTSTFWMLGMIHQWLIPWKSLVILAHPP